MKLRALRLHNVRRFAGRGVAIEGIGDGVNVLTAANEYGKSTCFDALHALFFQRHSGTPATVRALQPYSGGRPTVEADVETAEGRFRLTKRFLGGARAAVTDLVSGRLVAQADEAEAFIAELLRGGAGGPAGLLWVRQGITGLEDAQKREEREGQKRVREDLLSSVQGEVDALTGGRRMAQVLLRCEEERAALVTDGGRPKAGGPFEAAVKERDALAAEERRLEAEVNALRAALDERRDKRGRLTALEDRDAAAEREAAKAAAEAALAAARAHAEKLQAAEAEERLARHRSEAARKALDDFLRTGGQAAELRDRRGAVQQARDDALARRLAAREADERNETAVEAAEREEREAQALLARLEKAMKARDAAERLAGLRDRLAGAEAARRQVEEGEAGLRVLAVSDTALKELEELEAGIAGLRAAETAGATTLRIDYAEGAEGRVSRDRAPLAGGEEHVVSGVVRLEISGVGALAVSAGRADAAREKRIAAEEKRDALLRSLGVESLAEARGRKNAAAVRETELRLARERLALLAPDGIDGLREDVARIEGEAADGLELKGDPGEVSRARDAAARKLADARLAAREARPVREKAEAAVLEAEKALARIEADLAAVEAALGPEDGRAAREATLTADVAAAETALAEAAGLAEALRTGAPDLANAEAAVNRTRSAVERAAKDATALREELAELNGRIATQSDAAVEEAWQEAAEKRQAAEERVRRFEREVAVLDRLRGALEAARSAARDLYFEPVMSELRPLMALLFDDASVTFDDGSLLPHRIRRDGQEEEVAVLSGGTREQIAVLTRLAFARLLARDGRPAPVILDDALVYSDDDRIEKMFDALHRQSRDQQIIVFSCRQRAFEKLGGNSLRMIDWNPDQA